MNLCLTNVIISGSTIVRTSPGIILLFKLYRKTYFPIAVETKRPTSVPSTIDDNNYMLVLHAYGKCVYDVVDYLTLWGYFTPGLLFTILRKDLRVTFRTNLNSNVYFVRTKLPEYCLHNCLTYPVFLRRLNAILEEIQCFHYISESSPEKHEVKISWFSNC